MKKATRDRLFDKLNDAWDYHQNNETDAAWKALFETVQIIAVELQAMDKVLCDQCDSAATPYKRSQP